MKGGRFHARLVEVKRQLVLDALAEHDGSRTLAATALGIERTYLQRMIREYQITAPAPCRKGAG